MRIEILTDGQKKLLDFIRQYKRNYYLVGGTAIALQLGHRQSIDFDLFTSSKIKRLAIKKDAGAFGVPFNLLTESADQIHFVMNGVKITFFSYPYEVGHPVQFDNVITMPTLLSLAAMKAFALGRRAKWKDYVDLYFLLRDKFSIGEISHEANRIFSDSFSARLFREQLSFHKDIDYSEEVDYMPGFAVEAETVKAFLIDKALEGVVSPDITSGGYKCQI